MSNALSLNEMESLPRFAKGPLSSPSSKASSASPSPTNSPKFKTQICRSFEETGSCPYNSKCLFAHGKKELRSAPLSPRRPSVNALVVSMQIAGRKFSNALPKDVKIAPRVWTNSIEGATGAAPKTDNEGEKAIILYKTELCRSYAVNGTCPYGAKCQFAHGDEEIRPVERHKNYKTTKCEKFHTLGSCPFDLRCIFIHDEDERELPHSDKYDPEYASQARKRRASVQGLQAKTAADQADGLSGEFLRLR